MMAINFLLSDIINDLLQDNGIHVSSLVGEILAALIFFILAFVSGLIIYHLFEHYFSKWAKKTKTTLDDEITRKPLRGNYKMLE